MAYLDRITGTKPLPEVLKVMTEILALPGTNPQSPSKLGSQARKVLDDAREEVAALIGADHREITFVATGTESINLALQGLVRSASRAKSGKKIIVSAVEHVSVMNTVKALEKNGYELVVIPVDKQGIVDFDAYEAEVNSDTILVSIQLANPEIGTIQDVRRLASLARERGALFHTDAVDAVGWIPVDVNDLGIDAMSFSGTQFHGPSGAAVLYVRKGVSLLPVMFGGLQERYRRPGLENIPAIAGLGVAARFAKKKLKERQESAMKYAKALRQGIESIPEVELTGDPQCRLPGHVSMMVKFVEGEALLLMLDMKDVQATSGSSCTAKDLKISPVLMALGTDHTSAQGSLVFSTTADTTPADIDHTLEVLPVIIQKLRAMSPIWQSRQ